MTPGVVQFDGGPPVSVEIFTEPLELERGLMGRSKFSGAVFWMGKRADHGFWGKGCLVSIDVVFVDFDRVVGWLTLRPGDDTVRRLGRPSTTVIELPGGSFRGSMGQKVQISLT